MLFKNTPGEKIHYIADKLMSLRKNEVAKLENNPEVDLGDVTSINMTLLKGGAQGNSTKNNVFLFILALIHVQFVHFSSNILGNVVPPELSITFDIRIANDIKLDEFEKTVGTFFRFQNKRILIVSMFQQLNRSINGVKKQEEILN